MKTCYSSPIKVVFTCSGVHHNYVLFDHNPFKPSALMHTSRHRVTIKSPCNRSHISQIHQPLLFSTRLEWFTMKSINNLLYIWYRHYMVVTGLQITSCQTRSSYQQAIRIHITSQAHNTNGRDLTEKEPLTVSELLLAMFFPSQFTPIDRCVHDLGWNRLVIHVIWRCTWYLQKHM
jgi:hypothetical protein